MKIETFFEKFDQFADAPDAVGEMRELVLHLAFAGKLLTTDDAWPLEPLKSLATKIGSGATPAGGRESYFTEGVPLIRSMNVHFAGFEPKGLVFLSEEQASQLANVTVQYNDVLLNITGASIGRVTTAPPEMAGARVNQHVAIIRPIKELSAGFLAKFLASPTIQTLIDDVQVGATREALTKGMIEQFAIPLPPLAEQKRIVAKVDELMALCDQLEALQQERETQQAALARASLARFAAEPTPANLNFIFHPTYTITPADLRKSILTLAVQGKIVPQDADDNPADAYDEPCRAEQNGNGIPGSWALVSLAEIAQQIVDCPHSTPKWTSSGKICVRTNQFRPGRLDLSETKFVSEKTFEDRIQRLRPQEADILYSREGGILGIACRIPPKVELCLGQRMMLIRAGTSITPTYLELVLNAPLITEIARRQTTGVAAPRINVSTVKSYLIPVPPLAEQHRIVAKVAQLMALVDELETQVAASRDTAVNLLSALVAELTAVPKSSSDAE